MSETREQVYEFMKKNGPVLPVQIAKFLNTDIIIASAILSELTATKRATISHAAIGGSRVYYLHEQKHLLESKLFHALRSKEKEAYQLLKEKQVINEKELEPWQRIAFNDLKDFAIKVEVTTNDESYGFWVYYLTKEDDVRTRISEYLSQQQERTEEVIPEEIREKKTNEEIRESTPEETQQENTQITNNNHEETQINEEVSQKTKEKQTVFKEETGHFYTKIKTYFEKREMSVHKEKTIKKNKEFHFVVTLPTAVGNIPFFVKAADKKSISDTDLSLAYSDGQLQQLPTIFLIKGKITKKGKELEEKFHGKVTVIKL